MNRPSRKFWKWLAINLPVAGAIVYGLLADNPIGHLGVIVMWAFTLINIAILHAASEPGPIATMIAAKGPSVPHWLSHLYDISLALFLAYHGWIISACASLMSAVLNSLIFTTARETVKKSREPNTTPAP